jgi:hypothetical protein
MGIGFEGITNLIHVPGSGNIKHNMEVHRNLYKYLQQGWDFLNYKYKQVFSDTLNKENTIELQQKRLN